MYRPTITTADPTIPMKCGSSSADKSINMYRPTITTTDPPTPPKGGSSADKESITMSIEVINGMADTIAELENKIDFICEQMAKDFELPCNFSPIDEIMLAIGRCGEDCGDIPKSECWKRYFEEMQRRAEQ